MLLADDLSEAHLSDDRTAYCIRCLMPSQAASFIHKGSGSLPISRELFVVA